MLLYALFVGYQGASVPEAGHLLLTRADEDMKVPTPAHHLVFEPTSDLRVTDEGYYEFYDREHQARCWIARNRNGIAISCLPDPVVKP